MDFWAFGLKRVLDPWLPLFFQLWKGGKDEKRMLHMLTLFSNTLYVDCSFIQRSERCYELDLGKLGKIVNLAKLEKLVDTVKLVNLVKVVNRL